MVQCIKHSLIIIIIVNQVIANTVVVKCLGLFFHIISQYLFWSTYCRRRFQMHFRVMKFCYFDSSLIEVCSSGSKWSYFSIDSDHGLAPIRRRVSLWTNDHYNDVIMGAVASQNTSLTMVYSSVYSRRRSKKTFASLAFVWGIHRWPVNSLRKGPVRQKMFPFDNVIIELLCWRIHHSVSKS